MNRKYKTNRLIYFIKKQLFTINKIKFFVYPFVLGQASKPNRRPIINAIPHNIDKIQRIKAHLLSLCESVINPSRNLFCALRANAKANKPRKQKLIKRKNTIIGLTYQVERKE